MKRSGITSIVHQLVDTRLDRRTLLKRAAVLSLGTTGMFSLLAACDDDDEEDVEAAVDEEDEEEPEEETEDEPAAEEEEDEEEEEEPADEEPDEEEEDEDEEPADTDGEGQYGGRIVVANAGQPNTLDIHQTAGGRTVQLIGWHIFESLFTWDAEYNVMPQLASSYEADDEAITHTIGIRQGVPFHNGEELTVADVLTSLDRWSRLSPLGQLLYQSVDEVVEIDEHTVEFHMSAPLGTVPHLLARGGQGAAIYPASIIEPVGDDFLDDLIGTGPYEFVEMQADRFTRLQRFEDYVGPEDEQSGYAGQRMAYLDEIEFIPVPEESSRIAGLRSGEYDYLEEAVADQIDIMEDDPNINVQLLPIRSHGYIGLNHAEGLMSDLNIRKALQACMDVYPQGLASHGEGFFELGPGIMLPVTVWGDSDAGAEFYNMNDPELGAQLLEEAGYDGTPVRWLTTQDDLGDFLSAEVCAQQLEQAGFVVELIVVDEATLADRRSTPEGWDVWNGAFILRTDPTLLPYLSSCDYSGWWCSDEKEEAFERLLTSIDFDERYAAFEDMQRLFYEEVGGIKQQDNYGIMTVAARIQNFGPETTHFELEPEFTNCWVED
jgi:peptide/nickel transport system substrate-binding protein